MFKNIIHVQGQEDSKSQGYKLSPVNSKLNLKT